MTQSQIIQLKDFLNNLDVYPKTSPEAVVLENGSTLEQKLKDIQKQIDEHHIEWEQF